MKKWMSVFCATVFLTLTMAAPVRADMVAFDLREEVRESFLVHTGVYILIAVVIVVTVVIALVHRRKMKNK